jgi:hypothetical protein
LNVRVGVFEQRRHGGRIVVEVAGKVYNSVWYIFTLIFLECRAVEFGMSLQASDCSVSGFACPHLRSLTSTLGARLPSFQIGCCLLNRYLVLPSLDAVEDLIEHSTFETEFTNIAKGLPDLERVVSRIHAKNCRVRDFIKTLAVSFHCVSVNSLS